ncbi:hypothetical protein ACVK1X_003313 [Pseudomonas sp. PvR086]|jgi:hypothetical protein|nr:hypothetical protein SRABI130_02459 [Pseudomonas sp. Bi130]
MLCPAASVKQIIRPRSSYSQALVLPEQSVYFTSWPASLYSSSFSLPFASLITITNLPFVFNQVMVLGDLPIRAAKALLYR